MTRRVLIFGDVSPNVIDGSSIWLASITEIATRLFDETHVLLKFVPETDRLLGHLASVRSLTLHHPTREALASEHGGHTPGSAAVHAQALHELHDYDVVIVRGLDACWAFSRRAPVASRLWAYVTDLPFPPEKLSKNNVNRLHGISRSARRMLAQTESARSYLEAIAPGAASKTVLMPPMVPDTAFDQIEDERKQGAPLRLVYSGKFAREWRTLEMLELPRALQAMGIEASLTVVGAKFQKNKIDRDWHMRMRHALEAAVDDPSSGVQWLGGLTRQQSLRVMADSDVGIGWRSAELDSTLEVSTKALEYGAVGTAPLINATQEHFALYGAEYAGYVRGDHGVAEVAGAVSRLAASLDASKDAARRVSARFSMREAEGRLRSALQRAGGLSNAGSSLSSDAGGELLIASHDLKFMGELLDSLRSDKNFKIAVDRWKSLREHDEEESGRLLARASVVFCEWAGPNLVWYSNRVTPDQRLVARLHGFELRTGTWMREVKWERVARLVVVSEHYRSMALEKLPLEQEQVIVIPNAIDCADLARPKLPDSQFRVGLAGYVPFLKRPDRAVDLLEHLLAEDDRFSLHIRGRAPWEYPHVWSDPIAKQQYLELYSRISSSPALRARVVFEPFGANMGSWLRKIGVMLSPSDVESFHLAPAEGLASGAAVVAWARAGADGIFGASRVFDTTAEAAQSVLDSRDERAFLSLTRENQKFAARRWDLDVIMPMWSSVLSHAR